MASRLHFPLDAAFRIPEYFVTRVTAGVTTPVERPLLRVALGAGRYADIQSGPERFCGMSSRFTLLFVCNQAYLYSNFISEFGSAGFQVLLARNLAQAKTMLLDRPVNAVLLRHDCTADDRALAPQLKRIAPHISVYLLTDQQQRPPRAIDSVWSWATPDVAVARGIAILFRQLFKPRALSSKPRVVTEEVEPRVIAATANGSR